LKAEKPKGNAGKICDPFTQGSNRIEWKINDVKIQRQGS
jgi:hypothetical protein